jgi:GTP pyrophosphokinase
LETISEVKENKPAVAKSKSGITVRGINDVAVRFSRCCSPVPGDEIVGFVTRGRGVSIHRTDCVNMLHLPEEDRVRLIEAEWSVPEAEEKKDVYEAEIKIYTTNRMGVLADISKTFTENQISVLSMNVRTSKHGTGTISVGFHTKSVEHLRTLVQKLRNIEGIIDIERTSG